MSFREQRGVPEDVAGVLPGRADPDRLGERRAGLGLPETMVERWKPEGPPPAFEETGVEWIKVDEYI